MRELPFYLQKKKKKKKNKLFESAFTFMVLKLLMIISCWLLIHIFIFVISFFWAIVQYCCCGCLHRHQLFISFISLRLCNFICAVGVMKFRKEKCTCWHIHILYAMARYEYVRCCCCFFFNFLSLSLFSYIIQRIF